MGGNAGHPAVWVDDSHAIIRRGMWACLTGDGFTVVGESNGFRPLPRLQSVDILVFECLDASLRRAVRLTEGTDTRLIATVHEPRADGVCQLLEAGVRAVLRHEDLTAEGLAATVKAVGAGATAAPTDVLLRALVHARHVGITETGSLTDREREVLRWLAEGSDTLEIAHGMCFSERTVKNVVHDILMKLNCRTRAHAVALATRSGVI